jgi:hypothetical protein
MERQNYNCGSKIKTPADKKLIKIKIRQCTDVYDPILSVSLVALPASN